MRTLVIHPIDPTTDTLKKIYEGKECTVMRGINYDIELVIKEITEGGYDRIFLLGHGSPEGLWDRRNNSYVISAEEAQYLKGKKVYGIFCNANRFFWNNDIKGFCTGMFISEFMEAMQYDIDTTTKEIDESFELFCKVVNEAFDFEPEDMFKYVEEHYVGDTNVIKFNRWEMHNYKKV